MKRFTKLERDVKTAVNALDAKIDEALPVGSQVNVKVGRGTMPASIVAEARSGCVLVQSFTKRRKNHWKHYSDVELAD